MISTTSRRELVRVVHMPTGIEHISERMGDKDSLKRAGERAKAIVASKVWWEQNGPAPIVELTVEIEGREA